MKRIELSKVEINTDEILRTVAKEEDTKTVYEEPAVYCLDGIPKIIYGRLPDTGPRMMWALATIGYQNEVRSTAGGAIGQRGREKLGHSRIIGFRPRIPFSANYCSVSSAHDTHPEQHLEICNFGQILNGLYRDHAPAAYAHHQEELKKIRPDWIMENTVFTSGIVNRNNPLKYHFDKGNLDGVMSCMAVFRNLCDGGYLSVPEFNARWMLKDRSFLLFDGQSHLHGVTPIKRLNKRSYRYSIVYYALKGMIPCGSLESEIDRARTQKRETEKRRSTSAEKPSS